MEVEKCIQNCGQKPRGKRCRWKDNIKMDLIKTGCKGMD
jgi:hypothetical protein